MCEVERDFSQLFIRSVCGDSTGDEKYIFVQPSGEITSEALQLPDSEERSVPECIGVELLLCCSCYCGGEGGDHPHAPFAVGAARRGTPLPLQRLPLGLLTRPRQNQQHTNTAGTHAYML